MVLRTRIFKYAAVCAAALLSCAGPATTASAVSASDPNPVAAQLDAFWTPARMAAALPGDVTKGAETGTTAPALSPAVDGPQPGEYIPPSRSFDGVPQAGTFFWTDANGTGRTCSGAVVRSPGPDLVLSAGHCLKGYAGASPRRHLAFVPQYHDALKPFGIFPVRTGGIYVAQQYYDLGEHAGAEYDFAFAVTEPNQDGTRLQDAVGGARLLTGTGYYHAPVRMIGYPAGVEKPLECWSWTTEWVSDDPAEPGTFPRIACAGFVGGTSGGPMLVPWPGGWAVIGVIGGFHTGGNTPQISYSAYFGAATRAVYQAAISGAPPAGPASATQPHVRRTLTWDRGRVMAEHQAITAETGMPIYLCKPRSPWQRGTNENTNRLLRQYQPKGADLRTFSQADLDAIAHELNHRPRKVHGYRTPAEVYADLNSGDALTA